VLTKEKQAATVKQYRLYCTTCPYFRRVGWWPVCSANATCPATLWVSLGMWLPLHWRDIS